MSSCCAEFSTEKIEMAEKFALEDGRTDSLDLSIYAEYPASGLGKDAKLKISTALTEALFGEDYMAMTPDAAAQAYRDDRINEYRAENLPMTEIESLESSYLSHADSFFSDGYVEPLTRLLTKHLPEALESPADTSMLFLKEIEPNGNFSIGSDGITYIYNQYEIAPYAMGIIRITIPWEEIEGLRR